MLASEKMAKRAELYARLVTIDKGLEMAFGECSNRASATARKLLNERAQVCDGLLAVGYFSTDIDFDEVQVG